MTERFGTWVATQYVHSFDGDHVGQIHERRLLEQLGADRVRVTRECAPSAALDGHAMARLAGEWVCEVDVHGARRRLLGPDVVGQETEWMPGARTGRGMWPRLGFGFSSWSILLNPSREVSGAWFDVAGRPVAAVVEVATPDEGGDPPSLDLTSRPAIPSLDDGFTAVHHRIGPLVIVDGWSGAEQVERRLVVADATLGVSACLTVSEIGRTRTGELSFGPIR